MFEEIFKVKKPIIGMIHLAGTSKNEKIERALEELAIYEKEGVDAAIIEDYHGTFDDVHKVLEKSANEFNIIRGVNVLRDPYSAFMLATNYGAKFIQFDSVQKTHLEIKKYEELRKTYSNIAILGGIRFKYTHPTGNSLEEDIKDGISRCEGIVTTGSGTGIETPISKLKDFKKYLNTFPLIVGAGVTLENVYDQLVIADAAIVGSYFKPNKDTNAKVSKELVKSFMDRVRKIREFN